MSSEKEEALREEIEELRQRLAEQGHVEEALQEAERIINRSPAVAFLWRNAEGWPVEYVSRNVSRVFGYEAEDFLSGSLSYVELIHPEDLDTVAREVDEYSRDPQREEFVHRPYRILTSEGDVRWVDDRTAIRRDDRGGITHYQGIVLDITEKVNAEAQLERSLKDLKERNKELDCLYSIARVLEQEEIALEDILRRTVALIPPAYQVPESTFARVRHREAEYTTRPFRETCWKLESPIRVKAQQTGSVEVFVDPPETLVPGTPPFLAEEQALLDALAERLGRLIERMEAEEALRQNEAHYRNLVENLGEVLLTTDLEGKLTYVSPTIHDLTGYDPGEVFGSEFSEFVHPEDLPERRAHFQEILAGQPQVGSFRLKTRSGAYRWVQTSAQPIVKGRKVVGLQGVLMDVSDLKQTQEKLVESRERLETILASLPIGIVIIDRDTKTIVEANPAALSLIGAPQEQVVGHVCHRFICPAEEGYCPITDLGISLDNSERTLLDAQGNSVPIQKIVIPIDLDQRPFLIECFSDIRAQKKAQQEREAREKLQGVIEMAGAVCHELNQPMQAVVGYTDLLGLELPVDSPLRKYADAIRGQVRAMGEITQKLTGINRYRTRHYLGESRIIDIDRASGVVGRKSEPSSDPSSAKRG